MFDIFITITLKYEIQHIFINLNFIVIKLNVSYIILYRINYCKTCIICVGRLR